MFNLSICAISKLHKLEISNLRGAISKLYKLTNCAEHIHVYVHVMLKPGVKNYKLLFPGGAGLSRTGASTSTDEGGGRSRTGVKSLLQLIANSAGVNVDFEDASSDSSCEEEVEVEGEEEEREEEEKKKEEEVKGGEEEKEEESKVARKGEGDGGRGGEEEGGGEEAMEGTIDQDRDVTPIIEDPDEAASSEAEQHHLSDSISATSREVGDSERETQLKPSPSKSGDRRDDFVEGSLEC